MLEALRRIEADVAELKDRVGAASIPKWDLDEERAARACELHERAKQVLRVLGYS